MKNKSLSFLLVATMLAGSFLFSGCGNKPVGPTYRLSLEIWGVFDDSDTFTEINQKYKSANPQILDVKYKKISSDANEYEKQLLDAIASGNGPDVIFFHNDWLTKHQNKLAPLPDSATKITSFKDNFVDVAYADFIKDNLIYAMPLDCDTLALYYNKDLLNQAGITAPPKTWEELIKQISPLTKIDSFGNITQSAIALGRSKDPGGINRSSDILMLMMMQNGSVMFQNNEAEFNRGENSSSSPGVSALDFYTQFARGDSTNYTWNYKMDYSIDSFRYGKTAMMINYSYWAERYHQTDPKFNFEVAPVPQLNLSNQVNFANYWGLAVTNIKTVQQPTVQNNAGTYTNQDRINEAWKYIQYVTMKPNGANFDPTSQYLSLTQKTPARRDLIEKNKDTDFWNIFAAQALTAKSWPVPDPTAVEDIFTQMIDDVVSGNSTSTDAIRTGTARVNTLIKSNY